MIVIQDLVKNFGEVCAVDHANLEVDAGNAIAIHGPSGSGKTTLLRLIAGLELPDAGKVMIHGNMVSGAGVFIPPHEREVGFVFQSPALWPHMTVVQNILFGLKGLPKVQSRERLQELLDRMQMRGLEGRYPSQLSGGQARRVALARTLAPKPKILLMDEPLTHVDSALKTDLLELVNEIVCLESITMVYVTHDLGEATQIAGDQLLEMRMGRLLSQTI